MLGLQQLASAFSLQNLLGFLFFKKANLGDIVVDSGRCMFPVPDVCVCVYSRPTETASGQAQWKRVVPRSLS